MHEPPLWRDREQNEQLIGFECPSCGYVGFPARRAVCKRCGERVEPKRVELEERGVVQSYVVQHRLPDEFETPLPLAVLDIPQTGEGEPARVYGLFTETDPDAVGVGMEADAVFRELFDVAGLPAHSFKFTVPRGEKA